MFTAQEAAGEGLVVQVVPQRRRGGQERRDRGVVGRGACFDQLDQLAAVGVVRALSHRLGEKTGGAVFVAFEMCEATQGCKRLMGFGIGLAAQKQVAL